MHRVSWDFIRSKIYYVPIIVVIVVISFFPVGWDWINWFRPACLEMIAGRSPYNLSGFYNPPWVLLPLIPLALFPEKVGVVVISLIYLSTFVFVSRKLGARPLTTFLLMTTPNFLLYGLSFANIDWMVVLGLIMPPQIGLFFVLAKPQIGLGIAFFWIFETYQKGKLKAVIKAYSPVTIALILSFLVYGLWPLKPQQWAANSSLWPASIPIGLTLITVAIQNRRKGPAILSSPFLSPYVGIQSWPVAMLGLLPNQLATILATIGIWVVNIMENDNLRMWLFRIG